MELQVLSMELKTKCDVDKVEDCMERFRDYATKQTVEQIQEDMNNFANSEELERFMDEIEQLKAGALTFSTRREVEDRFREVIDDLTRRIKCKTTEDFVKKSLEPIGQR